MPIYEYSCTSCKHEFEDFLKVNDIDPLCPECKGKVQKKISHFSGVVKGSQNRTIDCIVGEDADRRRGYLQKRREKRAITT